MATRLAALATVLLICQLWRRTESKYIAIVFGEIAHARYVHSCIMHVHAITGAGCIYVLVHDDFR